MATQQDQNNQPSRMLGLLILALFLMLLAASIVLPVVFRASAVAPVNILTSALLIVGLFLSFIQAFPEVKVHIKAVSFPGKKLWLIIVSVLLLLSLSSNAYLLARANCCSKSNSPPAAVPVITVSPFPDPPSDFDSSLIPSGQAPAMDDPLRDNSQGYEWDIVSAATGSCMFQQNQYELAAPAGGNNGVGCNTESSKGVFKNFVYQIQMTILTGLDNGQSEAGPTFRVNTADNGQQYQVSFDAAGDWQVSTDFGALSGDEICTNPCPYFYKGHNQHNFITIRATGQSIQVQINGHPLGYYSDSTYASGYIGVEMSPGTENSSVAFSNARVWVLPS